MIIKKYGFLAIGLGFLVYSLYDVIVAYNVIDFKFDIMFAVICLVIHYFNFEISELKEQSKRDEDDHK